MEGRRTDGLAMLQVAGGTAALSIAIAVWVDDKAFGPTVQGTQVLTLAFLLAGLASTIASSGALGMVIDTVDLQVLLDEDPFLATAIGFMVGGLVIFGVTYFILLMTSV